MPTQYQLLRKGGVRDLFAAVDIPFDLSNPAWQSYRQWIKQGNTPLPMDPVVVVPPTAEELAAQAQQAADKVDIANARANAVIQYLVNHTPAQCVQKINTDVVDLASAKTMLGNFAIALCVLAKDKLR